MLTTLRLTVRGMENIPDTPKLLIVANHASYLDVLTIGFPFFKQGLRTRWVISKSNYRLWYLKWLYFLWRVVVLNGTIEKIKHALDEGLWVVIFPEGNERWCPPGQSKRKHPARGAAVIALSTGVPVIPVGIVGTDKVLPARSFRLNARHHIIVNIGKPFSYNIVDEAKIENELLESTTADIMAKIKALIDEVS
ncbi:MAG: lysophospholipid acyltransferase family protein [Candidatus Omnitrophica bacterium]|nr:lysophospholipid acyltransferase family protein [Candidatus Omnitrophota bacterium]